MKKVSNERVTTVESPVVELAQNDIATVSGGATQYVAINSWAVGTSSAFQKMMVAKLEVLGNPIAH